MKVLEALLQYHSNTMQIPFVTLCWLKQKFGTSSIHQNCNAIVQFFPTLLLNHAESIETVSLVFRHIRTLSPYYPYMLLEQRIV